MRTRPTGTPYLGRPRSLSCRMVTLGAADRGDIRNDQPDERTQGALHGLPKTRLCEGHCESAARMYLQTHKH